MLSPQNYYYQSPKYHFKIFNQYKQTPYLNILNKIINTQSSYHLHQYLYVIYELINQKQLFHKFQKLSTNQLHKLVQPINYKHKVNNEKYKAYIITYVQNPQTKIRTSVLLEHITQALCSIKQALNDQDYLLVYQETKQIVESIIKYDKLYKTQKCIYEPFIDIEVHGHINQQSQQSFIQQKLQYTLSTAYSQQYTQQQSSVYMQQLPQQYKQNNIKQYSIEQRQNLYKQYKKMIDNRILNIFQKGQQKLIENQLGEIGNISSLQKDVLKCTIISNISLLCQ